MQIARFITQMAVLAASLTPFASQARSLVDPSFAPTAGASFLQSLATERSYDVALKTDFRIESLAFLFTSGSGASDYVSSEKTSRELTVGEHTARVLEIYRQQTPFFSLDGLKIANVRDLRRLMMFTLAFHDIGKSIAARAGDKSQEMLYSEPIAKDLMKAAGFTPTEIKIAAALIWSHQIIGNYSRGLIAENTTVGIDDPLQAATEGTSKAAGDAGVDAKIFYQLMKVVFVCDAGSYETLRSRLFVKAPNGKLNPNDELQENITRLEKTL